MAVGAADASDLAASFFARSSRLKLLYSSSAFVLAWLRLHGNSQRAAAPACTRREILLGSVSAGTGTAGVI